MGIPGSANLMLFGGAAAYQINQSLRFNSADSANLSKSFTASASCTFSFWIKRANLGGGEQYLFWCDGGAGNHWGLRYDGDDKFTIFKTQSGADTATTSTAVYRDASGWYHIVVNGTPTFYVNGVQVATGSYTWAHIGGTAYIGRRSSTYLNAYLAEFNYIDGSNLTPSSFGETDTITGAWIPKKYSGSYGTNGFYLNFSDNSGTTSTTLGKDSSGNSNNWTPNNFSVTAGAGNDVLSDTPTNNYATLNPLTKDSNTTLSEGNLRAAGSSSTAYATNTQATFAQSSGKWYYEATYVSSSSTLEAVGWARTSLLPTSNPTTDGGLVYRPNQGDYFDLSGTNYTSKPTTSTGSVIQVAIDFDAGKIWFGSGGTWFNSGDPAAGSNTAMTFTGGAEQLSPCVRALAATFDFNFGQRAFAYTPPTGYKALNTANLPEPTIKKGSKYFKPLIYAPNGSSSFAVTGVGFQPDLVWIKSRNYTEDHQVNDSLRGATKALQTNIAGTEVTQSNGLTSFDSDGFTVGNLSDYNYNGDSIISWNWKEGASNGLDIVSYEGTGSTQTISHNLGVAPAFVIVKTLDNGRDWYCYHQSLGAGKTILLSYSGGEFSSTNYWNNTAPSSTVFTVGSDVGTNENANTYIAYCFSEVASFSKFGSYTGNGSSDGPFVFCGFRPAWLLIKRTDSASDWILQDNKRLGYNVDNNDLIPNQSYAEATDDRLDQLSNGFKLRSTFATSNASGGTYIFAAFSETAFKYANAR